ncbi:MAG: AI-2E family transporter [Clostridia bacterium]|nr:AI-2E family transporter [Clostridia bacterium]
MKRWITDEYRPLARMIMAVTAFGVLLVAALVYLDRITGFLSQLVGILSPFLVGGALAFIQMPIARRVETFLCRTLFRKSLKTRAPRVMSAIFSILVVILLLLIFLNILLPQVITSVNALVKQVTAFVNENDDQINTLLKRAGIISADVDPLNSVWQNILSSVGKYADILPTVLRTSYNLVYSIVFKTLIGLIVSFYLLIDSKRMSRKCKQVCYAVLEKEQAERLILWSRKANRLFAGFTTGKIVDSIVVGIICYIVMLLLRLEYPLLISVIIGVTNVLPFFGPFIGAIPSILILAIVNPPSALTFAIFILVLQQLDGNLIGPKILGDYVGISPMLTMAAILIGSGLMGFVGLVIAVPICALIYALIHTYIEAKLVEKGMSTHTHAYDMLPLPDETEEAPKKSYIATIREKIRKRKK